MFNITHQQRNAKQNYYEVSLKRKQENIRIPYVVLGDVSILYKNEYEIGLWALSYIKKKTEIGRAYV